MEEERVDLLRGEVGELEGRDSKETVVGMHHMRTESIFINSKITSRSKKSRSNCKNTYYSSAGSP